MSLPLEQRDLDDLANGPCYCAKLRWRHGHEHGICLACYRADPAKYEPIVRAARNAYREWLAMTATMGEVGLPTTQPAIRSKKSGRIAE